MSASTALGAVSRSLRNLLLSEMSITPQVPVTLLGPDESGAPRRVNLFLYRVEEHPQLRNREFSLRAGTTSTLAAPPLSLVLYYVLTAYAASDPQTGAADAHAILGDAMRVLYEHPVIPDADLEGDLGDAHEQLRVMQVALDSEELGRVWATFDAPYRLSAMYEISVVQLDQSAGTDATVAERVRTIGVPDVRAPFSPPRLVGIEPVAGAPGTVVTVTGEDLAGWTAEVRDVRNGGRVRSRDHRRHVHVRRSRRARSWLPPGTHRRLTTGAGDIRLRGDLTCPAVATETPRYTHHLDHLEDELLLLDLLLLRAVLRMRRDGPPASGSQDVYIGHDEVDRLLEPADASIERDQDLDRRIDDCRLAIDEAARHGQAQGSRFPLLDLAGHAGLSAAEYQALVVCLAPELDRKYDRLFCYLQDDITRKRAERRPRPAAARR